jgi:hypothetical protein
MRRPPGLVSVLTLWVLLAGLGLLGIPVPECM